MKTHLLKLLMIALIFGTAIGSTKIASGQSLIQDSCTGIHYTENQDKRCNECLVNRVKKDSIINRLLKDSYLVDSIFNASNEQKSVLLVQLDDKERSLDKANLRLKISRTINKFGIPGGVLAGILIGILIN